MTEKRFNEGWKFWVDRNAFALVWNVPQQARSVTLPHDAMLEAPAYEGSSNGRNTGFRDGDVYNYVKTYHAPESDRHRTLVLRFEGVYMNAAVYVNGQRAATCPYGYSGFEARLDPFLRYGGDNEIRVIANNSAMTNSRWYSGGGIYRDVFLCSAGLTYLVPQGVQVTVENADRDAAALLVTAEITTRNPCGEDLLLNTTLFDGEGNAVAQDTCPLSLFEGETRRLARRLLVERPRLWSAETPELYTCRSRLFSRGRQIDEQSAVFGIRTLSLDARRGLLVNGSAVKLRGACVHHDSGLLGAATYYDAEYRRVSLLRQAGFNAVRMAHQPAAPALLRACDEVGMYVMDEAFDMWTRGKADSDYSQYFREWWERDVESMVRKNFNHPCVIMVSIGNEIPEIGTKLGAKIAHDLHRKIKSLDPTRFTLAGINGVFATGDAVGTILADLREQLKAEKAENWNVNDFLSAMGQHMDRIIRHEEIGKRLDLALADTDIAGYNYMTARYEPDSAAYPNRVIVGSETYPPEISRNWEIVGRLPNVIGDFTWTGWDYIGEAGVGCPSYGEKETPFGLGYPCQLAYCGDFDITGFRRPLSYLREIVFGGRRDPCIAVQNPWRYGEALNRTPWILSDAVSSWTFTGREDQPAVVEVYSAGDEAELFINGVSQGRKPAGPQAGFRVLFETRYRPGVVQAVSYQDGAVIGRADIKTAGPASRITLRAEEGRTGELVFVDIQLEDSEGNPAAAAELTLSASCSGSADILGFGSGDPKPTGNYTTNTADTFNGRALLILRRSEPAQPCTVAVSGGQMSAELIIGAFPKRTEHD